MSDSGRVRAAATGTGDGPEAARGVAPELAALLPLGLVVAVFFWPLLLTDQQVYLRDALRIALPSRLFMFAELEAGRFPLWFPFEGGGVPFVGQLATGSFHPVNAAYLLAPFGRAFQLNYLMFYELAAFGTYAWARGRELSRCAAVVAALAFALCGALVSQSNLTYLAGNASVPLALAAGEWCLKRPTGWRTLAASGALALIVLAGEPQSLVMAGLLLALQAALVGGPAGLRLRRLGLLGALAAGAAALAAIQLLPSLEALRQSARVESVNRGYWSFPPLRLFELAVANMFNEGAGVNELFTRVYHESYPWAPRVYLGATTVVLAVLGAFERRARAVALFTALAVWLSFGPDFGLDSVFAWVVPLWKGFRYPEKMVSFVSLGLALLAAYGVDRARLGKGALAAGRAAAVLAIFAAAFAGFGQLQELDDLQALFAHMAEPTWIAASFVLTLTVALTLARRRAWNIAALALVALPLFAANQRAPRYLSLKDLLVEPWASQVIRDEYRGAFPARVYTLPPRRDSPSYVPNVDDVVLAQHIVNVRNELRSDYSSLFGIENYSQYLPLGNGTQSQMMRKQGHQRLLARFLRVFATDYVVVSDPSIEVPLGWSAAGADPISRVRLWKSDDRLPHVYVASGARKVDDPAAAIELIGTPQFSPADTTLTDCDVTPADAEPAARGVAKVTDWKPDEVELAVRTRTSGFVVLNDNWAPGWHGFVDGTETAVCRMNGFVRGVRVPAGTHDVRFVYAPASFLHGAAITLLTLIAWMVAAVFLKGRAPSAALV